MTETTGEFPFEELRRADGDYFDTVAEAQVAGFDLDQIWSVVVEDDSWLYGPSRHYVNRIGYIATNERHDDNTYFEEVV